jgi:DUF1365 family protein
MQPAQQSSQQREIGQGIEIRTGASLYTCRLRHVRNAPIRNGFTYRGFVWLVDLDDMPRLPLPLRPLVRFRARDHLGDPGASLRSNIDRYLAGHGIRLRGGKVLMLTHARVFGYLFNPVTVYWCHHRNGALACVVAEVTNTDGERHCYLLKPDSRGRANAAKESYVSPFRAVDGVYQMLLPEPDERLALSIRLKLPGQAPFIATMRGQRRRPKASNLLRMAVRFPFSAIAVSIRIRWQRIRFYLRGLSIVPQTEPHMIRSPRP